MDGWMDGWRERERERERGGGEGEGEGEREMGELISLCDYLNYYF
jgi:hypothetical protein